MHQKIRKQRNPHHQDPDGQLKKKPSLRMMLVQQLQAPAGEQQQVQVQETRLYVIQAQTPKARALEKENLVDKEPINQDDIIPHMTLERDLEKIHMKNIDTEDLTTLGITTQVIMVKTLEKVVLTTDQVTKVKEGKNKHWS